MMGPGWLRRITFPAPFPTLCERILLLPDIGFFNAWLFLRPVLWYCPWINIDTLRICDPYEDQSDIYSNEFILCERPGVKMHQ